MDSRVALAFDFAPDVPAHVLAAFVGDVDHPRVEGAPPLPPPVVEGWDRWAPDWRARDVGLPTSEGDPFAEEPWRHDWTRCFAVGEPQLSWGPLRRWRLEGTAFMTGGPRQVVSVLAWLAPYLDRPDQKPNPIGHVVFEEVEGPVVILAGATGLEAEPFTYVWEQGPR